VKKHRPWIGRRRAKRAPTSGAGNMNGSGKRAMILHTSESGAGGNAISGVVSWVHRKRSSYHLIIDDRAKKATQIYPFNKGARSMLHGYGPNGSGCNLDGTIVIQVCILGRARDNPAMHLSPWAKDMLRDICNSWDIPLTDRTSTHRSTHEWNKSGISTHSSAPGNDHTDPGRTPSTQWWRRPDHHTRHWWHTHRHYTR
jgi:hypothetical protein